MVAKLISKSRVETLSVKSEPVDIKSEQLDVFAIKTGPRNYNFIDNNIFIHAITLYSYILVFKFVSLVNILSIYFITKSSENDYMNN